MVFIKVYPPFIDFGEPTSKISTIRVLTQSEHNDGDNTMERIQKFALSPDNKVAEQKVPSAMSRSTKTLSGLKYLAIPIN